MANLNFSKIASAALSEQKDEKEITEYKEFYWKYLTKIKERDFVLEQLKFIYADFLKYKIKSAFFIDEERIKIETKTEEFIANNFPNEVLEVYKKKIPRKTRVTQHLDDKPFWAQLVVGLLSVPAQVDEQYRNEWEYKMKFLIFLHGCLSHYGMSPLINRREGKIYKRYNLYVDHYFKSRLKQIEYKIFISALELHSDFITPYEKKQPLLINGKLIPHKNIHRLKITSTLLLDDEIELFAISKDFSWNSREKDELKFIENCVNETDTLLRNPYLLKQQISFRNNSSNFVDPQRIRDLSKIKGKKYDISKLVKLCEELNDISAGGNSFSASYLLRAIIDHVPPIFGCASFSEVANNYSGGTRSFKKSMLNLNTSLRNIADNNIHSQIRDKEVLPSPMQTDFTPELDLLLSEVLRIFK